MGPSLHTVGREGLRARVEVVKEAEGRPVVFQHEMLGKGAMGVKGRM